MEDSEDNGSDGWQVNPSDIEDTLHPFTGIWDLPVVHATEIGDTLVRAINVTVGLVALLTIYPLEQLRAWLGYEMKERFEFVPPEKIIPADPSVSGPALESLKHNLHRKELRDMYVNLLAAAMHKDTARDAHPAYVEIIRQLVPSEVVILNHVAKHRQESYRVLLIRSFAKSTSVPENVSNALSGVPLFPSIPTFEHTLHAAGHLDNLERLGLVRVRTQVNLYQLNETSEREMRIKCSIKKQLTNLIDASEAEILVDRLIYNDTKFKCTTFGRKFLDVCSPDG